MRPRRCAAGCCTELCDYASVEAGPDGVTVLASLAVS